MGLATAQKLLEAGAKVVLTGRSPERLAAAEQQLVGADVMTVAADVARPADLDAVVDAIRARHGRLDGVFANAGVGGDGTTPTTPRPEGAPGADREPSR